MAECNHCGSFVTDDYARVFGDNQNRVDDCRNCPTVRNTTEEADDGREVLLRDLEEPAGGERDERAVAAEDGGERVTDDEGGEDGNVSEDEIEPETQTETEDEDGGRLQSRLSTMVSALRS